MLQDQHGRNWYPRSGYQMIDKFIQILRNAVQPVVVYDTETTGVTKHSYIVQFAGLKCLPANGQYYISETMDQLIRPPIPMPKGASDVNHITDDMLKDAPTEEFVVDQIAAFFNNSVISGYNQDHFDNNMIDHMYQRTMGVNFEPAVSIDALVIARSLVDRHDLADGRFTLGSVSQLYGIHTDENEVLHDALADTKVTMKLLWALARDYAGSTLPQDYLSMSEKPIITISAMSRVTYSKENDYVVIDVASNGHTGQFRYEVYEKRFVEISGDVMSTGNMEQFIKDADAFAGGDISKWK